MTVETGIQIIRDGGLLLGLLFVLVGGYRRWWVWGYQLSEMERDRNEWKTLFLRSMRVAETAVTVAKNTTNGE